MSDQKNDTSEFILKLIDMMNSYSDIICWNQNQTEIVVKDSEKIADMVLPKFFRHSKFESFVRQLNMYNFHKVCRQKNQAIHFKNDIFFKGNENNFYKIKRKKKNQAKPKLSHLLQTNIKFIEEDNNIPSVYKNLLVQLLNFKQSTLNANKRCFTLLNSLTDQVKISKLKKLDPSISEIKDSFELLAQKSDQIESVLKFMKNNSTESALALSIQKLKFPQSAPIFKNEHPFYRQHHENHEDPSTQNTKLKQSSPVIQKNKIDLQHYKSSFKLYSFRSITSFIDVCKQEKFVKIQDNNKSEFSIQLNSDNQQKNQ